MNTTRLTTACCGLASSKRQAMGGGDSSAQGAAPNPSPSVNPSRSPETSLTDGNLAGASAPAPLIQAWSADGRSVVYLPVSPRNHRLLDDGGEDAPRHGGV